MKKYRLNIAQFAAFVFMSMVIIVIVIMMAWMIKDMLLYPEHVFTTYKG